MNLKRGEEVRISYMDCFNPYAIRVKQLRFDCDCMACKPEHREASDARRERIALMVEKLDQYASKITIMAPPNSPAECECALKHLSLAQDTIMLVKEENLLGELPLAYERLARCYIQAGQNIEARRELDRAEQYKKYVSVIVPTPWFT